jgi:hypothetical protein
MCHAAPEKTRKLGFPSIKLFLDRLDFTPNLLVHANVRFRITIESKVFAPASIENKRNQH